MEINSKIHVEQPAPPGIHRRRSDKRDGQTDKKINVFGHPAMGEIRAPPNLAQLKTPITL